MATTTKGLLAKEDVKYWDGSNASFQRIDSTGGTQTLTPVGNDVDILQVYGSTLSSRNATTLINAIKTIGSSECSIVISPGTWTIGENVSIPSNITVKVPRGATLSIDSGVTLTINGTLEAGLYQIFSGSGTVTGFSAEKYYLQWWGAKCDGVTDDTTAVQAAIDYCMPLCIDLTVTGTTLISTVYIDKVVDGNTASATVPGDAIVDANGNDTYFKFVGENGGGFISSTANTMFDTRLSNVTSTLPVVQMVKFIKIIFESTNPATANYVLSAKYLRTAFVDCEFRKIKCLTEATILTQSLYFINCQARRWTGTFFYSKNANFDLTAVGGLWEAGGDAFEIDYPVGSTFMGSNIEGMTNFAIKYVGGYAFSVRGCYFEGNGLNVPGGCSIDGSAGTGADASENVTLISNYFSGDSGDTSKAQVLWGESTASSSMGNLCTTTLHGFVTNSRVSVYADYARTSLSSNDTNIYNNIRNEFESGTLFRSPGQYAYGGMIYSDFVGGSGAFLRLRTLQNKVASTHGVNIDDQGDVEVTQNLTVSNYQEMPEITAPSSPAANTARIFVEDNGAGKTQLSVLFPTGAKQIIATEP